MLKCRNNIMLAIGLEYRWAAVYRIGSRASYGYPGPSVNNGYITV